MTDQLKFIIILSCALLWTTRPLAQVVTVEQLKAQLQKSREDTSLVMVLIDICNLVENKDEKLYYAKRASNLSTRLNFQKGIARSKICEAEVQIDLLQFAEAKALVGQSMAFFVQDESAHEFAELHLLMARIHDGQSNFDSAFAYFDRSIELAGRGGFKVTEAEANYYKGKLLNETGDNLSAEATLKKSLGYYRSVDKKEGLWYVLNSLGVLYDDLGQYPLALQNYMEALEMVTDLGNVDGQVMLLNNIATLYYQIHKLEESLEYYDKAIDLASGDPAPERSWYLVSNKAQIYTEMGDTLNALVHFKKALDLSKKLDDECELAYLLDGIGEIMRNQNKLDSAKKCYREAIRICRDCNNQIVLVIVTRGLGIAYMQEGLFAESEKLLGQSIEISSQSNFPKEEEKGLYELYKLHKLRGNPNKALGYFERYVAVRDSIFGNEANMEVSRIISEYEFRKELQRMEFGRQADELQLMAELSREESNKNVLLLVLVLTVLLAATLVRSYFLLQAHNRRLEILNEEKNTLMGVVAHDLRSPLNNIKGLLVLMQGDDNLAGLSKESRQYFDLLNDSVAQMRDMIDKALDINAIEEMKLNLNLQRQDLGKILRSVGDSFQFMASKKNIAIHHRFDLSQYYANVDKNYIVQVFDNLLSNAIKFSEFDKNIFLEIRHDGQWIEATVRDEGPGISAEDQAKLFTKFQKLGAKPTANEQSIGLGLSIVKKFVKAMHGEISCHSELGKGSTFMVRFQAG